MNTLTARRPAVIFALAAAAALALAGCATTTPDQAAGPTTAGQSVTITDAWVKALRPEDARLVTEFLRVTATHLTDHAATLAAQEADR